MPARHSHPVRPAGSRPFPEGPLGAGQASTHDSQFNSTLWMVDLPSRKDAVLNSIGATVPVLLSVAAPSREPGGANALPTRSLAAVENQGSVVAAGRTNNNPGGRTMHRLLLAMVLAMSCASALADTPAASGPAGHTVGEEAAVLAALDRYMLAISANDLDAMASMQTPSRIRP